MKPTQREECYKPLLCSGAWQILKMRITMSAIIEKNKGSIRFISSPLNCQSWKGSFFAYHNSNKNLIKGSNYQPKLEENVGAGASKRMEITAASTEKSGQHFYSIPVKFTGISSFGLRTWMNMAAWIWELHDSKTAMGPEVPEVAWTLN